MNEEIKSMLEDCIDNYFYECSKGTSLFDDIPTFEISRELVDEIDKKFIVSLKGDMKNE